MCCLRQSTLFYKNNRIWACAIANKIMQEATVVN